jgi:hypothetical protein
LASNNGDLVALEGNFDAWTTLMVRMIVVELVEDVEVV